MFKDGARMVTGGVGVEGGRDKDLGREIMRCGGGGGMKTGGCAVRTEVINSHLPSSLPFLSAALTCC